MAKSVRIETISMLLLILQSSLSARVSVMVHSHHFIPLLETSSLTAVKLSTASVLADPVKSEQPGQLSPAANTLFVVEQYSGVEPEPHRSPSRNSALYLHCGLTEIVS